MTRPDPVRCCARWLYRGSTRAKCHREPGHVGKHHNGTVSWDDDTPGALPGPTPVTRGDRRYAQLQALLATWLDDDEPAMVATWIVEDPASVAAFAFEYFEDNSGYRPVANVDTKGLI